MLDTHTKAIFRVDKQTAKYLRVFQRFSTFTYWIFQNIWRSQLVEKNVAIVLDGMFLKFC